MDTTSPALLNHTNTTADRAIGWLIGRVHMVEFAINMADQDTGRGQVVCARVGYHAPDDEGNDGRRTAISHLQFSIGHALHAVVLQVCEDLGLDPETHGVEVA